MRKRIRRREFITLLGGAAASWPLAARAQQSERMRRVGVLMPAAADDAAFQAWVGAFLAGPCVIRLDHRSQCADRHPMGRSHPAEIRKHAAELVALAPDVILAHGAPTLGPLLQATRTVPIVFPIVGDPVAAGFVDSLARPGGNATGFMDLEYGMAGKWLELLKQIASGVTRVAVLRDPATPTGPAQFGVIQAVAPSLGSNPGQRPRRARGRARRRGIRARVEWRSDRDAKRVGERSSRSDHQAGDPAQVPAVYFARYFVTDGGLLSYGIDIVDQYRSAAGYVDRILKGEKPADLPVVQSTRVELIINLNTAKALGLEIPPTLLARADEVIE